MIVLAKLERRPVRLDMSLYPYLPRAKVRATKAGDYMQLLGTSPMPVALQMGGAA
jgi:hypothetical protein